MSRLHLSSKSLHGVLKDMDIPDGPGDGVRWELTSIRSFCESFINIQLVLADLGMIWSCRWWWGGVGWWWWWPQQEPSYALGLTKNLI